MGWHVDLVCEANSCWVVVPQTHRGELPAVGRRTRGVHIVRLCKTSMSCKTQVRSFGEGGVTYRGHWPSFLCGVRRTEAWSCFEGWSFMCAALFKDCFLHVEICMSLTASRVAMVNILAAPFLAWHFQALCAWWPSLFYRGVLKQRCTSSPRHLWDRDSIPNFFSNPCSTVISPSRDGPTIQMFLLQAT